MARSPNLVLLVSDQHRADVMGCAGHPVERTPNLDRLAAEGVRFARVSCQGPLCMPARASLLTERYVRDHGVFDNSSEVDPATPTCRHALRAAGWHTAVIGKTHLWQHNARAARGRHVREFATSSARTGTTKSTRPSASSPTSRTRMRTPTTWRRADCSRRTGATWERGATCVA
jgi:arylsulfatase A-like enzyme